MTTRTDVAEAAVKAVLRRAGPDRSLKRSEIYREVSEVIELSAEVMSAALARLVKKHKIIRTGYGWYRISTEVHTADLWERPADETDLYRLFDANGRLLYVGISLSAAQRMGQHRRGRSWWPQVATITVEHYASRREAALQERHAIVNENPLHNIVHATGDAA